MTEQSAGETSHVSVVIPTYESASVISQSIESVLEQTYPDFEIIVVDDGSTDHTETVVSEYDDPRLYYYSHEINKGVSAARNTGIDQATGEYIAFLDADDEWLPTKLERQVGEFERSTADILYSDCYLLREGAKHRVRSPDVANPERHYIKIFNSSVIPLMSSLIVHADCLDGERFDESLQGPEDLHFIVRMCKRCTPGKVDEPLVYYRYVHDSLSHSNTARFHDHHTRAIEDLVEKMPELQQYYDEKRATDLWKSAFKLASEGQLGDARRFAKQSIATAPNQSQVAPAYGLLFVLYLPLGSLRSPILRFAETTYQRLVWSGKL